jgi:hypothetical protein
MGILAPSSSFGNKSPGMATGALVSVQAGQDLTTLAGLADHAFELRDPP